MMMNARANTLTTTLTQKEALQKSLLTPLEQPPMGTTGVDESATGRSDGNKEGNAVEGETSTRNEHVPPRCRSGERIKCSDDQGAAEEENVGDMYSTGVNGESKEGERFVNSNEASIDKVEDTDYASTGNVAVSGSMGAEVPSPSNCPPKDYNITSKDDGEAPADEPKLLRNDEAGQTESETSDVGQTVTLDETNHGNDCPTEEYVKLLSKMDSPRQVSGRPKQSRLDDSHFSASADAEVGDSEKASENYGAQYLNDDATPKGTEIRDTQELGSNQELTYLRDL